MKGERKRSQEELYDNEEEAEVVKEVEAMVIGEDMAG